MNIEEFINELDTLNYGIVAFNTYRLNKENHCYLMIGERGSTGRFIKDECRADQINALLESVVLRLHRLKATGLVAPEAEQPSGRSESGTATADGRR